MVKYILTLAAKSSLEEIKAFSTSEFGVRQTAIYLAELRDRIRFLVENPQMGIARNDLGLHWSCYSYPEG